MVKVSTRKRASASAPTNPKDSHCVTLRGRTFSDADLKLICDCVLEFFDHGRTQISLEICKRLRWRQPNGWPKDRACREVLVRLEGRGIIKLPSPIRGKQIAKRPKPRKRKTRFIFKPVVFPKDISFDFAKGNKAEREWNDLVATHHYLGHKIVVGRCIKYLLKHRGETVGAISFSSAAWKLEPRDRVLSALGFSTERIRNCVLSNTRFLILEDKSVPNLASRMLSALTRQVAHDWEQYYCLKPEVVETFVQPSRFKGTCYKAANWREIGYTRGFAKKGPGHMNSQEPKQIFLYGLSANMRRRLAVGQPIDDSEKRND